ncbi:hypothetical protein [Streptomyces sp. NPDC127197]|uniref:hypothetical protein n=1 Tax=Streptomyces sp. NPDC127197 TaxID=3345388 RepID=UPI00363F56C2
MNGGQGDDEPQVRCCGRGDRLVDIRLVKGLEDAAGLSGDTDTDRGVAEDVAVPLRVPEQRPQRDDPALALEAQENSRDVAQSSSPETACSVTETGHERVPSKPEH